jgi:hypothetical protein
VTRDDSNYEPPAAREVTSAYGLVETAAGATNPYGAITLMDDDGKRPGE